MYRYFHINYFSAIIGEDIFNVKILLILLSFDEK